jgi:hypothetical protein
VNEVRPEGRIQYGHGGEEDLPKRMLEESYRRNQNL